MHRRSGCRSTAGRCTTPVRQCIDVRDVVPRQVRFTTPVRQCTDVRGVVPRQSGSPHRSANAPMFGMSFHGRSGSPHRFANASTFGMSFHGRSGSPHRFANASTFGCRSTAGRCESTWLRWVRGWMVAFFGVLPAVVVSGALETPRRWWLRVASCHPAGASLRNGGGCSIGEFERGLFDQEMGCTTRTAGSPSTA
jgi:hypothetical protein